jgi:hypothetical protein
VPYFHRKVFAYTRIEFLMEFLEASTVAIMAMALETSSKNQ